MIIMSMRTYAYEDYGLVLNEETIKMICEKVFTDEPHNEANDGYALYDAEICQMAGNFTGETYPITDNGNDDWNNSTTYDDDSVFYIPVKKYPTLFKNAYKNIDEMVAEFKDALGEYLPDGYNYRANICHIVGTTWG
jgi:hypothetical protein